MSCKQLSGTTFCMSHRVKQSLEWSRSIHKLEMMEVYFKITGYEIGRFWKDLNHR